jgi:type II secretory pathway pseudopilin PulG
VDDAIDKKRRRKQQMSDAKERREAINEARVAAGEAPLSDEDGYALSDNELSDTQRQIQKRPKKPPGRPKKIKAFAGVDPDELDPIEPSARQELTNTFTAVFRAVEQSEEESDG